MEVKSLTAAQFRSTLTTNNGDDLHFFSINKLKELGFKQVDRLPFSIKILLEGVLRKLDGHTITGEHVQQIINWNQDSVKQEQLEIPLMPARIILQDFTGTAVATDLAALREAMQRLQQDPTKINPLIPVDLVIDHSLQVDSYGQHSSIAENERLEFERNQERYTFFKWMSTAFTNFNVIPPSSGIIHQVNLEYLSPVIQTAEVEGETCAFPDTVLGTDSHTTMINGLGVLGWGVGGIEAEAAMLGLPQYLVTPQVIGVKLVGRLQEGVTTTDLALTITNLLRSKGVVGQFVEFYGPGLTSLSLADRTTVANMAPEYGATMGFFPVDQETITYLKLTGRDEQQINLVEAYTKAQGLFHDEDMEEPIYSEKLTVDLSTITPSLAGPKRPQDRVDLNNLKKQFREVLKTPAEQGGFGLTEEQMKKNISLRLENGQEAVLGTGSLVLAAITSCTNTSNPSVMVAAGLLAKKAVEHGLKTKPLLKTSLTPGSLVVSQYLTRSGLLPYLEELGFHIAGYGCATCTGGGGSFKPEIEAAIKEHDLTVCSILSGNRNFEGRIHPLVKANYLASPPLVIAYALAGRMDIDLYHEPLGINEYGAAVYLQDIWPSSQEIEETINQAINPELFKETYRQIYSANQRWNELEVTDKELYAWQEDSTYIIEPPFLQDVKQKVDSIKPIKAAHILAMLGDSVTTDHISPAGTIQPNSPAGEFLEQAGVERIYFNTYGARRGNHEIMMRGTFANVRLRNELIPGIEGGLTKYIPRNELVTIYEAAMTYMANKRPTIVIAGKEYGTGSSRDWAAKGTKMLGVKAVLVESFERIHRSNLIGLGVLPLEFLPGESRHSLGLTGLEVFDIEIDDQIIPKQRVTIQAMRPDQTKFSFEAVLRLDTPIEINYYRHGGILPLMLREFINH